MPADYSGDGSTDPALVSVRPDGNLAWHILNDIGEEMVLQFGLNGDLPLAGDYNCDNKADLVVVREFNGLNQWYFFLSGDSSVTGPIEFGFSGDEPHVADVDGDSCDEIIISREANGGIDWWYRDLAEYTPHFVQWGLQGDELLSPADINGDGRDDWHVARSVAGTRLIYSYLGSPGEVQVRSFITDQGELLSGSFSGIGRAEFASFDPADNSFLILRGDVFFDTETSSLRGAVLLRPDGGVSQLGPLAPDTNTDPGADADSSEGDGVVNRVTCDVVGDFFDGGGGALWKPVSESTGEPVILLDAEYWTATDSIQVFGNSGRLLANGSFRTCCPNDNRAHFDISESANELAVDKPIVVRFNLKNGREECRVVEDPRDRND